ncbi:MAG: methyltransferase domain-containing protein [Gammaproteobacteria bacterium]|nr:methyltransferase domain-containing protein [Gammaproteobacteria bacterium]MCP5135988.1 methyltransferase domain-containing protein [Gammaproteobacteria bacterium]
MNDLLPNFVELMHAFSPREYGETKLLDSDDVSTPFTSLRQEDWVEALSLWNQHGRGLIGGMRPRSCPTCGHAGNRALFESYDGYPYVECTSCGCWYVPLVVTAEVFEQFFSSCSEAAEVSHRVFQNRMTDLSRNLNLGRIGEYLDSLVPLLQGDGGFRYLDMGCGLGYSLEAGASRGLDATGVESSKECIDLGRAKGLNIYSHEEMNWSSESFDLISFWESLEHMEDPAKVLTECASLLRPGGLLAFTVPNLNSPLVRVQRQDCSFIHGGYDTPGHVNMFSGTHLAHLCGRTGFELLALDGQYGLNLGELVSYFVGKHHGAYDMRKGQHVQAEMDQSVTAFLRSIGPLYSLFERASLTAPILFGLACRKADAQRMRESVQKFSTQRQAEINKQLAGMILQPEELLSLPKQLEELERRLAASQAELRDTQEAHAVSLGELSEARAILGWCPSFVQGAIRYLQGRFSKTRD